MIIAGGTYRENCLYPRWDHIYGSGLRATVAVSSVSPGTTLHTYVHPEWHDDVEATLRSLGLCGKLVPTDQQITYSFLHALQKLDLPREPEKKEPLLHAKGEVVLRFGMLEGDAQVEGDRVVYDPQSSSALFEDNGSRSRTLATIIAWSDLNPGIPGGPDRYLPSLASLTAAVVDWRDQGSAPHLIIVKDGLGGLILFQGDEPTLVPTYAAESFFRIGSGDVIAAAFAYAWGELRLAPGEAADYAARCAAYFVEGPRLPLPPPAELVGRMPAPKRKQDLCILGVGDFPLQSLVLPTKGWIEYLGGTVSHTMFDLFDRPRSGDVVDLILVGDTRQPRHIEMAASAAINPTVVFWPGRDIATARDLFPNAVITGDYATALYHAMRGPEA